METVNFDFTKNPMLRSRTNINIREIVNIFKKCLKNEKFQNGETSVIVSYKKRDRFSPEEISEYSTLLQDVIINICGEYFNGRADLERLYIGDRSDLSDLVALACGDGLIGLETTRNALVRNFDFDRLKTVLELRNISLDDELKFCLSNSKSNIEDCYIKFLMDSGAKIKEGLGYYRNYYIGLNLLKNGTIPTGEDLIYACTINDQYTAKVMLKYGIDVNYRKCSHRNIYNGKDKIKIEIVRDLPLYHALENNNVELVRFLVDNGAEFGYVKNMMFNKGCSKEDIEQMNKKFKQYCPDKIITDVNEDD